MEYDYTGIGSGVSVSPAVLLGLKETLHLSFMNLKHVEARRLRTSGHITSGDTGDTVPNL